jgi:hypothetical protein
MHGAKDTGSSNGAGADYDAAEERAARRQIRAIERARNPQATDQYRGGHLVFRIEGREVSAVEYLGHLVGLAHEYDEQTRLDAAVSGFVDTDKVGVVHPPAVDRLPASILAPIRGSYEPPQLSVTALGIPAQLLTEDFSAAHTIIDALEAQRNVEVLHERPGHRHVGISGLAQRS